MPENIVRTDIRLPAELHARLVALAQRERRSINAQIAVLIEAATREEDTVKEFRIIPVECPKCDWRIRREGMWTQSRADEIAAQTLEEHDLIAHS